MPKKSSFVFVTTLLSTTIGVSLRSRNTLRFGGTEDIKAYKDSHLAAPKFDSVSLGVPAISSEQWVSYEKGLLNSSVSRFSGDPSIEKAAQYIEAQFRNLGLTVESEYFDAPVSDSNFRTRNIIARLEGTTSESILVGAHYDSLPVVGPSPGADDNASGVATLLSVAYALRHLPNKLKRSVVFVAFSGEEQGMKGSSHFALESAPSMNIKSAIILDQDGNPGSSRALIYESVGDSNDKLRIIDTLAQSTDPDISGGFEVNHNGFGSDHVSLTTEANIPSVLVIERENMSFATKYGHTSKDTIENIDPTYGSAIARTVAQATVRLALA
jgi:Zn-dependent M28 family amino/carboxypeptidase